MIDLKHLMDLYQKGVVTAKPLLYAELGSKVQALVKQGMKKTHAVEKTARDCGVGVAIVWRACNLLSRF